MNAQMLTMACAIISDVVVVSSPCWCRNSNEAVQTLCHIPLVSKHSLAELPLAPTMQRMPELDPPPQRRQTV